MKKKNGKKLEVFLEFLIFGVVVGVFEDLIAVKFATNEPFTWKIVGIVVLVAIPFAFLGEVIVDRSSFLYTLAKRLKRKKV
ncbi:MAG: hypothetical protein WD200_00135 [Candidatus Andersenbacteria bacterium]